jgi:hypothetical protein
VTPEEKLFHVTSVLKAAEVEVLVMGGHAARYYGVSRNTNDFDLVTSLNTPGDLRGKLAQLTTLGPLREAPVWRSMDFARFELGPLPDGREEYLEFWFRNHLLSDFATLQSRAEVGEYGGGPIGFLSITDLMRSKETERESDWTDIGLLEEIADQRRLATLQHDSGAVPDALANLRSRKGMDLVIKRGLADGDSASRAITACRHLVSFAFLLPLIGVAGLEMTRPPKPPSPIEPTTLAAIASTKFGSTQHFAWIEICRRSYKRAAMEADRADKQKSLASHRLRGE